MSINKSAIQSLNDAATFPEDFRIAYMQLKNVQRKITLYQAGTDPIFNAAINATVGAPERAEIATMKPGIDALLTEWETAHSGIIQPT